MSKTNTLKTLINHNGDPDAIIDHWDPSSNRYAVWGFEEYFLIKNNGECILNGEKIESSPIEALQNTINNWKTTRLDMAAVGYISYDFKKLLYKNISFKNTKNDYPLLWFGKPKYIEKFSINQKSITPSQMNVILKQKMDIPNKLKYKYVIKKIKKFLLEGESYQINYTQPKKYEIVSDPISTYLKMRDHIKPYYGIYLNLDFLQILSFSPERFFNKKNNSITSIPMKGTRPRSNNFIEDINLSNQLYYSEKDRAEHLMIVDLIRNDLGKICDFNTIKVNNLFNIKSFKTVHQMISSISGILKYNINETSIIKALFPGGSITGAPKERSMEIIDEIENYSRGVYTGSLGYIKNNGDMDFNIAIRTMTIQKNIGTYPVGGGIVWDSNFFEEWKEAHQKSKIITPFVKLNNINKINFETELY